MKRIVNILVLAAALVVAVACSQERKSFTYEAPGAVEAAFPVLSLVPEDSPAAICLDSLSKLESVYSKYPMDSLDWGAFASCKAVLSFFFEKKLYPCLYVDCGRPVGSDDPELAALLSRTVAKNLYFKPLEKDGNTVLFFTPSDAAILNLGYALDSGNSILDAPLFRQALDQTPVGKGVRMYFSNRDAIKLLPKFFLAAHMDRRTSAAFLSGAASWTVLANEDKLLWDVAPLAGDDDALFVNFFRKQQPALSTVSPIVPNVAAFVTDLPIASWQERRIAYESWLEATSKLANYKRRLAEVKAKTGKDPYAWEKMLSPKEIVYIHFSRFRVVAIRPGARFNEHEVARNPYDGCVRALFGGAFGMPGESHYACKGKWIIIGPEEDVKAFMRLPAGNIQLPFDGKKVNCGVWARGQASLWDESGLVRAQLSR
ncbi:MAG: hypothetical protein J5764_04660 [Bacteroidales bacterium]|nr:hypothetical protein [Bacteroidales bacterium]